MTLSTRARLGVVGALALWVPGAVPAREVASGIVERIGSSICGAGTHLITDPCTGASTVARAPSLDMFLCSNVEVEGPDIGVLCTVIDVQSLVLPPAACVVQPLNLEVFDPDSTYVQWRKAPCTGTYDVIRGRIEDLSFSGGAVSLGHVSCLIDDTSVLSTFSFPTARDNQAPSEGRAFFYLVRGQGTIGVTPYGLSSAGLAEVPDQGGCRL